MTEPSERRERAEPRAPTATVSSLKSEDSTEQLIAKPKVKKIRQSVPKVPKSVEAGSDSTKTSKNKRLVVWLGLGQVVLGALLVGAGAVAVVKGAALARVGAGLWAGCVAVVAGVVGVLAGINDCYGLHQGNSGGPLLTAFLALSLLCLACGNSAAVLAATGLQRDTQRSHLALPSFQDEMEAWTPVLTNIALLIIASTHCLVCIITICHLSRRVCPCLRPRQPFDHNQFDPQFKPCVVESGEEKGKELAKDLEGKLNGESLKKKKGDTPEYGSANSKEKLVTRWLGQAAPAPAPLPAVPLPVPVPVQTGRRRPAGVRKPRKPPPVMLVPAHPASTVSANVI
ncbi:hypothetical protein NE865_12447 [Phthorimaea operculella]|nr:hypothetical protein NE865_12447 [Phthorimaea operculella]